MAIRNPSPATLKRYGLTYAQWCNMLYLQGGTCYVCLRDPPSGFLCIDHQHIRGWKAMPAAKRATYVRGLLCSYCNRRLVAKGMTADKAARIHSYLTMFSQRKAAV